MLTYVFPVTSKYVHTHFYLFVQKLDVIAWPVLPTDLFVAFFFFLFIYFFYSHRQACVRNMPFTTCVNVETLLKYWA